MYLRLIFLLAICTASWAEDLKLFKRSIESGHKRCRPGDSWKEQCNLCYCGTKGVPFCTGKACYMPPNNIPSDYVDSCDAGTRWRSGCEVCFCTVQGVPQCSPTHHCVSDSYRKKRETEQMHYCQPNYQWDDGCNNFGCNADGNSYSTLKLCRPDQYKKEVHSCEKGAKFTVQGMNCHCTEKGVGICEEKSRTKRDLEKIEPVKYCQPDFHWDDGCNDFGCTPDGMSYSTEKLCPPDQYKKEVHSCAKGAKFTIKGMNCHCTENGYGVCDEVKSRTKRDLIEQIGKVKFCQPGFSWHDGCNQQGCSEDGTMYSTAKACPSSEINENVAICEPGKTWKLGNRNCQCNNKGYGECSASRRRRAVILDDSEEEEENRRRKKEGKPQLYCQPTFTWNDGCGHFRCNEDSQVVHVKGDCDDPSQKQKVPRCKEGAQWGYKASSLKCVCKNGIGECQT